MSNASTFWGRAWIYDGEATARHIHLNCAYFYNVN